MAKEGQIAGLEGIAGALKTAAQKGPPPVHLWNPPDCGEIDMRIAADGTWFYQKTPIGRPALVRLFASVLRARRGSLCPGHPCGKVRHHGRRGAVPGGRARSSTRLILPHGAGRPGPALPHQCGRLGDMRTRQPAAFRARARDRRAQALPARAAQPVGQSDARRCSMISSISARSVISTACACSGWRRAPTFFAMAPAASLAGMM